MSDFDEVVKRNKTQAEHIKKMVAWLESDKREIENQAARIAELETALEEIAYGSFGKSVAVKNIAREALKGKQP